MNDDTHWLRYAIQLAETAAREGEVPVGAVLVRDNIILGEGWNQPIRSNDPTAHAEIVALRKAAQLENNYRLLHTTLYVTLEPCPMCVGAISHARVQRVVFGATDPKAEKFNHTTQYESGLLADECGLLLQNFFKERR